MLVKQHTSFRCMLLGILFLLLNCVCTAAPVIKITSEDYKQAISLQLIQNTGATETEEESQLITTSYVSQVTPFSVRKQFPCLACNTSSNRLIAPAAFSSQSSYLSARCFLPIPGYYAFLFRYNLF